MLALFSFILLLATVILIDGQTAKPMASKILSGNHEGWPGTVARTAPIAKVLSGLSRSKFNELDEQKMA